MGDVVGYQRLYSSSIEELKLVIIHRVIRITTGNDGTVVSFYLQGDNSVHPLPDGPVPPSFIVGKVLFHVPAWLGTMIYPVVSALQNPFFLVLPVILVVIILLLWRE